MNNLNDYLERYGKDDLTQFAKSLGIRKLSKLRKAALAQKIADYLLTVEVMTHRLAILTDAQILLLERAIDKPFTPSSEALEDAYKLNTMDYGVIDLDDRLLIPEDVKVAYRAINTPEFHHYRKQLSWLMSCLEIHNAFYGVAPVEIVYEMYQRRPKYKIGQEAMLELFEKIPIDLNPCFLLEGILVQYRFRDEEAVKALTAMQRGKNYYIPTYREVLDYTKHQYLFEEEAYDKLRIFFIKNKAMSFEDADEAAYEIWLAFERGSGMGDIVNWLGREKDIIFNSEKELDQFLALIQQANNHTRMLANRGYKPSELSADRNNMSRANYPTIVPGSRITADLMKEALPDINAMGFEVDMDGESTTVPVIKYPNGLGKGAIVSSKKIYPNDPCPCGSGKKYKQCCGRK